MNNASIHTTITMTDRFVVLDMRDAYTCSFTEFYPFCPKLYYFSNFKDFNTNTPT